VPVAPQLIVSPPRLVRRRGRLRHALWSLDAGAFPLTPLQAARHRLRPLVVRAPQQRPGGIR
jgi:hypothetical protein